MLAALWWLHGAFHSRRSCKQCPEILTECVFHVCRYNSGNPSYATQCDVVPGTPGSLANCVTTATSDPSFIAPGGGTSSAVSNGYAYFALSPDVMSCQITPGGLKNCALACPNGSCGTLTTFFGIAVSGDGTQAYLTDAYNIYACDIATGGGTFTTCSTIYSRPGATEFIGLSLLGEFTDFQTPVLFVTSYDLFANPSLSQVEAFTMAKSSGPGGVTLTPLPSALYTYPEAQYFNFLYRIAFGAY